MSNKFRVPNSASTSKNIYEIYHLKDNPFPAVPYHGTGLNLFFETGDTKNAMSKFIDFVTSKKTLFYLRDKDYRGRGLGKTALLHGIEDKINADLGEELLKDKANNFTIFCITVDPEPTPKEPITVYFFERLLVKHCIENSPFFATALMRSVLIGVPSISEEIQTSLEQAKTLSEFWDILDENSTKWTKKQLSEFKTLFSKLTGILNSVCSKHFNRYDIFIGVPRAPSNLLNKDDILEFYDALKDIVNPEKTSLYVWKQQYHNIIIDMLAQLCDLAKITDLVFSIDQFEYIWTKMSGKIQREFTDWLRQRVSKNLSSPSSLHMFFVIHPQLQATMAPVWQSSGLDRSFPVYETQTSNFTIEYALDINSIKEIVKGYLKESYIENYSPSDFSPFTEKQIEAIYEPEKTIGSTLSRCFHILEINAQQGNKDININLDNEIQASNPSSSFPPPSEE